MKRKLITSFFLLLSFLLFIFPASVFPAYNFVAAIGTIGGGASNLDGIHHLDVAGDGTNIPLITGDIAVIVTSAYKAFHYRYDSTSSQSELDPDVIAPDSVGAGVGRWLIARDIEDFEADVLVYYNNTTDLLDNATLGSGLTLSSGTLSLHDTLLDLIGLTPQKGGMIYWDSVNTMARLSFNASDVEGYILQATGAYPNTIPGLTNTLNITKFLFPNSNDPTTDTEAQCSWDKNQESLECYGGTNGSQILAGMKKCEDIVLATPDDLQTETDAWPLKHFLAEKYPGGVTMISVHIATQATCTDGINLEEWTNSGTAWSTGASLVTAGTTLSGTYTEVTSFDDASMAADSWLFVDLASGGCDVSFFEFTICFVIEEYN